MEEDRVWLDNDDKIMDILDNIETENKGYPIFRGRKNDKY